MLTSSIKVRPGMVIQSRSILRTKSEDTFQTRKYESCQEAGWRQVSSGEASSLLTCSEDTPPIMNKPKDLATVGNIVPMADGIARQV